jgi:nucleoside-diphosphate-sugar epimerase
MVKVKRVAVLGATGVAGRNFVTVAKADGLELRTERVDIFDYSRLCEWLSGCDAVVNLASSIPTKFPRGIEVAELWKQNDRIRSEGVKNLVAACEVAGVKLLIQQSIAMLSCDGPYASASTMEEFLRTSTIECRIVRGALFYGPSTGFVERIRSELQSNVTTVIKQGVDCRDKWLSAVHVEDFARAVLTVLKYGEPGGVYVACDDKPMQWKNIYKQAADYFGWEIVPQSGGQHWPDFRVSNEGLQELGWHPKNQLLVRSTKD